MNIYDIVIIFGLVAVVIAAFALKKRDSGNGGGESAGGCSGDCMSCPSRYIHDMADKEDSVRNI